MTDFLQTTSTEEERSALQALVARELRRLGLPEQRFVIQASFLTFAPMDLAILIRWPITMAFQGRPTGVIQIGSRPRNWSPESRVVMPYARVMEPERLVKEIHEWCRTMTAITREAVERRGGRWPNGWPRLQQRGSITVNAMEVRPGTVTTHGKAITKRRKRSKVR